MRGATSCSSFSSSRFLPSSPSSPSRRRLRPPAPPRALGARSRRGRSSRLKLAPPSLPCGLGPRIPNEEVVDPCPRGRKPPLIIVGPEALRAGLSPLFESLMLLKTVWLSLPRGRLFTAMTLDDACARDCGKLGPGPGVRVCFEDATVRSTVAMSSSTAAAARWRPVGCFGPSLLSSGLLRRAETENCRNEAAMPSVTRQRSGLVWPTAECSGCRIIRTQLLCGGR